MIFFLFSLSYFYLTTPIYALKAFPTRLEERAANTASPSLPVSSAKEPNETALSAGPIQPRQRPINIPSPTIMPSSLKVNQKAPGDYERHMNAPFFQGNVILPILEVTNVLEPQIVSLIVFDIKNRKFPRLNKDSYEELLHTGGIPGQYFCRRSFGTWDVLQRRNTLRS